MAELLGMSQKGASTFYLYAGLLGLLAALFQGEYSAEECPIFGTKHNTELTLRGTRRIVMNFGSPAQCKGNVTGWRFCYYQNINDTFNYIFGNDVSSTLAVFRSLDSSYSIYEPLKENRKEITISIEHVLNISNFTCMNVELNPEEYFEVKENDIVGACIRGVNPLILVGRSTGSNSNYRIERGCNLNRNVATSDLTQLSDSLLHLYADIAVADSCRAGNNPPPSVAVMSGFSGTYLNTRYPVTCGNHITKWHYCYYTEAATPGSTLSMTVAVWSLDAGTNTFIVSPSSIRNITIQHVQTFAKIFCKEESLNESEVVAVSHGSILGVVLPSENAIPIIKSNAGFRVLIRKLPYDDRPRNFQRLQALPRRRTGMHLHITVGNTDLPTTHPAHTTDSSSTRDIASTNSNITLTTATASEEALRNSISDAVILLPTIFSAFTIAVVVIAAVTVSCIIIYVKKKSHHYETVKPLNTNARRYLRSSHQNGPNFNMVKNMAYHSRFNKGMKRIFVPSADGNVAIHGAHNICGENDYACGQNDYACINDNNDSPYTLMNETQT